MRQVKEIKGDKNGKRGYQNILIYRWYDSVHKNALKGLSEVTTVDTFINVRMQIDPMKSGIFLHANEKHTQEEIRKNTIHTGSK